MGRERLARRDAALETLGRGSGFVSFWSNNDDVGADVEVDIDAETDVAEEDDKGVRGGLGGNFGGYSSACYTASLSFA